MPDPTLEAKARDRAVKLLRGDAVGAGDGGTFIPRVPSVDELATAMLEFATPATEQPGGEVTQADRAGGEAVYRDYLAHKLDDAGGEYEGEECAIHAFHRGRRAGVAAGLEKAAGIADDNRLAGGRVIAAAIRQEIGNHG